MRRFIAIFFLLAVIFQYNQLSAEDGVKFGFRAGLSTPSDNIADVYNKSEVEVDGEDGLADLYHDGMKFGYFVGMRLRVELSENIDFYGGLSWNKFPEHDILVEYDDYKATLKASTNIVPINAGVQLYVFKSLISVYGLGELSYNYISSSVDYSVAGIDLFISQSPSDNRIGCGLGVGADLNLKLVTLNLEAKYSYANLLLKDDGESKKSFLQVGVGVYF